MRRGTRAVDPEQARFYLALGAAGEVGRAAELAGISRDQAVAWATDFARPSWYTRRTEAAQRLFDLATEALGLLRQALRAASGNDPAQPPPRPGGPGLRDLAMVAERLYAAALRLDAEVGANGNRGFEIVLDGLGEDPADPAGDAPAAPRAEDGDA